MRPKHISVTPRQEGHVEGVIDVTKYLGADTFLIVDCPGMGKITVRVHGDPSHRPGDAVGLKVDPELTHYFDGDGDGDGLACR